MLWTGTDRYLCGSCGRSIQKQAYGSAQDVAQVQENGSEDRALFIADGVSELHRRDGYGCVPVSATDDDNGGVQHLLRVPLGDGIDTRKGGDKPCVGRDEDVCRYGGTSAEAFQVGYCGKKYDRRPRC